MLVGVGVGPGDPELVTVAALRAVRDADRVLAPSLSIDAVGRAESIIREAAPDVRCERVAFPMTGGGEVAVADRVTAMLDAGETVAFVTLGDPNVYSTFTSVAARVRAVRPDAAITTVPGIMAFQALAATAAAVVLDGTQAMALVTGLDASLADLRAAVADPSRAVVVYKGGRHLPEIAKVLADAGRLDGAVIGELLGLPGERVAPVADVADQPASYLATVIVPPVGGP